jgi:hypothetical protein
MVDAIFKFMERLPPLKDEKSPGLASALGFVFGGIGLGLYFLSFVDFLIPIGIVILATIVLGAVSADLGILGLIGGAIVAALWGYFRAINSNERLARRTHVPKEQA